MFSFPFGRTYISFSSDQDSQRGYTKSVKNKCINVIDQKKRRKTDPMEIDDTQPWVPLDTVTPEQEVLRNEQTEILHAALGKLKESYRDHLSIA